MQLGLHPLYRLYETADGWVCIAATKDEQWRGLLDALGEPSVGDDPRFGDASARAAHRQELDEVLEPLFRRQASADVFAALDGHGVPCEIADPDFARHAFDDPEMRERGLLVEQHHPKLGRFEHSAPPSPFRTRPDGSGGHLPWSVSTPARSCVSTTSTTTRSRSCWPVKPYSKICGSTDRAA